MDTPRATRNRKRKVDNDFFMDESIDHIEQIAYEEEMKTLTRKRARFSSQSQQQQQSSALNQSIELGPSTPSASYSQSPQSPTFKNFINDTSSSANFLNEIHIQQSPSIESKTVNPVNNMQTQQQLRQPRENKTPGIKHTHTHTHTHTQSVFCNDNSPLHM
jgi:hypothetical protein